MRITHRRAPAHLCTQDPRGTAVKDHNAIVLRAESMDVKMQWLQRLQRASAASQPPARKRVGAHTTHARTQSAVCLGVCVHGVACLRA